MGNTTSAYEESPGLSYEEFIHGPAGPTSPIVLQKLPVSWAPALICSSEGKRPLPPALWLTHVGSPSPALLTARPPLPWCLPQYTWPLLCLHASVPSGPGPSAPVL